MSRESIYLPEELAKGAELKDKTEKAKTDILFILSKKPLGKSWKEIHKERTESDIGRTLIS